uniref:CCHC-type domain-containing protein n=1 Tax=Lutzomyia longipalpis TaxID=7200 RepID=A0A1B0C8T2_LUTLO
MFPELKILHSQVQQLNKAVKNYQDDGNLDGDFQCDVEAKLQCLMGWQQRFSLACASAQAELKTREQHDSFNKMCTEYWEWSADTEYHLRLWLSRTKQKLAGAQAALGANSQDSSVMATMKELVNAMQGQARSKAALTGTAASALKHLPVSEANYHVAWEILQNRFNKPNSIVAEYVQTFYAQPKLNQPDSGKLRGMFNVFEEVTHGLKAMNQLSHDPFMIHSALQMVDAETKTLWYRETTGKHSVTWTQFCEFLARRCDSLELGGAIGGSHAPAKPSQPPKQSSGKGKNSLVTTNPQEQGSQAGRHKPHQCPTFLAKTPAERRNAVYTLKLCWNCMKPNHFTKDCPSGACRQCGKKHNTLLHDGFQRETGNGEATKSDSAKPTNTPGSAGGSTGSGSMPPPAVSFPTTVAANDVTSMAAIQSHQVLLPTVQVLVADIWGNQHRCRALIDSCSQPNCITRSLAQKLALPMKYSGQNINGLGLSGVSASQSAMELQRQLDLMMSSGGFKLKKWTSNSPEVLAQIPEEDQEGSSTLDMDFEGTVKTLGLFWNKILDVFKFAVSEFSETVTKRSILSEMSRIFDPLGFLSPITISAKILLQSLWPLKVEWDDGLSEEVVQKWLQYQTNIRRAAQGVAVPRQATCKGKPQRSQLFLFCDASEKAYGACVYLRTTDADNRVHSKLLNSKTKVAPLQQLTIPRLELCAADLGAKLLKRNLDALEIPIDEIHAFSDSMVTLHWINGEPQRWKTFVGNRVARIQNIIPAERWHHVKSEENPADMASRGVTAEALNPESIWWHGPPWMLDPDLQFETPQLNPDDEAAREQRKQVSLVAVNEDVWSFIPRFSSFTRLVRCIAIWRRYFTILKQRVAKQPVPHGPLTVVEVKSAKVVLLKAVQLQAFSWDYNKLNVKCKVSKRSNIRKLRPFMDNNGLIRVGGRISKADVSYDHKHPILLPKEHHVTQLIQQKYTRIHFTVVTKWCWLTSDNNIGLFVELKLLTKLSTIASPALRPIPKLFNNSWVIVMSLG